MWKDSTKRRQARLEATVGDLWARWQQYMEGHKKPKSQKDDRRLYERFLQPWARRPLSEVTRSDVAGLHARIGRDNGEYLANRLLALASAMFSEARRAGIFTGENPCRDIRRFREESRDRWLDAAELKRFFAALHQEPDLFRDYFLLLLLTGARKSNVLAMRWEQVDLGRGLWRIPETKGGMVVIVPLVQPAVEILLRRQREANGHGWVFPGRHGKGHLADPYKPWRRICSQAGLENLRIHDCRRTLGSWMATQGTSLPVIGKTLGHRSLQATEVYARLSTDPVHEAMERATGAMLEAEKKSENYGDGH